MVSSRHLSCLVRHQLTNEQKWCKSLVLTKLSLSITLIFHWLIIIWNEVIELSAFELFLFLMHRDELVGIQTIWWVDYQLAVGFLTGSWKSNMDVWISNQLFGNPTACLSWPRCSGDDPYAMDLFLFSKGSNLCNPDNNKGLLSLHTTADHVTYPMEPEDWEYWFLHFWGFSPLFHNDMMITNYPCIS